MANKKDDEAPSITVVPNSARRITQAPPPPKYLSGSGGFHPPSTDSAYWARQAGKPDWTYWSNMAVVDLDAACYLSVDIDPRGARKFGGDGEKFPDAQRRQQIAWNHLGQGLPAHLTQSDRDYDGVPSGVTLSEFRAWGESLPAPFTFPDEFPRVQAAPQPAALVAPKPTQDKPMATKERNSLLRIIRALDVMAKLPDRGSASSIATQLEQLGFTGPGDDTIRNVIREARALEKD